MPGKITDLPLLTDPTTADWNEVVNGGVNKRVALSNLPRGLGITVDDTVAPGAAPASVAVYLNMLANIVKTMARKANWDSSNIPFISRALITCGFTPTDDFTSGVIPTGYTWQGAPFMTPGTVNYSQGGDYLYCYYGGSFGRGFLSKPITNAAGAWQNKAITARLRTSYLAQAGLRVDDGTDDNYIEFFLESTAPGLSALKYATRTGGGAVSTVATSLSLPSTQFLTMQLKCAYSAPNYIMACYVLSEDGSIMYIYQTAALVWMPAAGRAGMLFNGSANYVNGAWDWFYSNFA